MKTQKVAMLNVMRPLVLLIFCTFVVPKETPGHVVKMVPTTKLQHTLPCPVGDEFCAKDKLGYEAINQLHVAIDDDHDGHLDRSESDEYLRDELEYEDGFDRHSKFHGSDDNISVNDLWTLWTESPVYNWTVDDVVDWLEHNVELAQYTETFRINAVEGRILPRIAANGKYMLSILGIKNAIDKQKLAVKAQDLVLFGPPKMGHNYVKDLLLVFSIVVAAGGCWLAYIQNRYSQEHLKKVMKDLDNLQTAEDNLMQLQQKLHEAHKEKEDVAEEKKSLELKMEDEILNAKQEAEQLRRTRECTEEEIGRLKLAEQELEKLKRALERAEYELKHRQAAPLGELQQWLQLTYEVESKHYDIKREAAEKQLIVAKEMCDKIRRKRGAFLGSLRVAHTTSVDDTDHSISRARSALEEVKLDLQERTHRWHKMEAICGFNIIANPGYDFLDSLLRSPMGSSVSTTNLQNIVSPLNVDDADEDMPPGPFTHSAGFYGSSSNVLHTVPIHRSPSPRFGDRFDAAMHPLPAVAELRERKGHSTILDSYGGSYDSLPTHASLPPAVPCVPQRSTAFRPAHTPMSNQVSTNQSSRVATEVSKVEEEESGSEGSSTENVHAASNDKVEFGLHELSYNSTQHQHGTDPRDRSQTYTKSQSMETKSSTPRPRALPMSLSEGALSKINGQNGTQRRLMQSAGTPETVDEEVSSLDDSNDSQSSDVTSSKQTSKNSKKKSFMKLLNKKIKPNKTT